MPTGAKWKKLLKKVFLIKVVFGVDFSANRVILLPVMRDRIRLENYTVRVDYFDKHEVDSFPKTREGFNGAIKRAIETGFDVVHHKVREDFKDVGDGVVWENKGSLNWMK